MFDAPEAPGGASTVSTAVKNGRCTIIIAAGGDFVGRPLIFTVTSAAEGCKATDSVDLPPA